MIRPTPASHKPRPYRLRDGFLSIAIVLGFFFAFVSPPASANASIHGRAAVVDEIDTLDIQGTRVRLAMVDAPESRQTCSDAYGR